LLLVARDRRTTLILLVYGLCLCALFGVSAVYHRWNWSPAARSWMRRLDHATIFLFIAGSYTPLCALGIGGDQGRRLLTPVWLGAALGSAQSIFWIRAPKAIAALAYVAFGWAGVWTLPRLHSVIGMRGLVLLVASGAAYTLGALVYALRRPDPAPTVFGYHEI